MSDLPTVGVEEEFLLVDPRSGEPAPRNAEVAAEAETRSVTLQLELSSCQVETTSSVATTSAQLGEELAGLRRTAAQAAEAVGVRLLALGLPPASRTPSRSPTPPGIGESARSSGWSRMSKAFADATCTCRCPTVRPPFRSAIGCGRGCRVCLRCRRIRLSTATPTAATRAGAASAWRRWPAAGAPPFFTSPEEYDRTVRMLVDTGAILDPGMISWDVRPSASFPTVEVRVADVPATVAETVLLATLISAAAMTALDERGRGPIGGGVKRLPPGALRAAYWKAAHDGLSGHAVDLINGLGAVPAREQLGTLVRRVRPALDALGEHDRVVAELDRIAAHGNGAMRQLRAWHKRGEVMDVIAEAATATLS